MHKNRTPMLIWRCTSVCLDPLCSPPVSQGSECVFLRPILGNVTDGNRPHVSPWRPFTQDWWVRFYSSLSSVRSICSHKLRADSRDVYIVFITPCTLRRDISRSYIWTKNGLISNVQQVTLEVWHELLYSHLYINVYNIKWGRVKRLHKVLAWNY